MVIEAILMQIKSVLNIEKTINKIKENSKTTNKDEYEKQILKLNNDIDKIKRLKKLAY